MTRDEIADRLARLERELERAREELEAIRALTKSTASLPVAAEPAVTPAPPPTPDPAARLAAAWRALERGKAADAIAQASTALREVSSADDAGLLKEIERFATVAVSTTRGDARRLAEDLALRIQQRTTPQPTEQPAEPVEPPPVAWERAAAPAPRPRARAAPTVPRRATGPSLGERATGWLRTEFTGARAFAVVGGSVLLLGVIFLFVLAANRGWVGPGARVALGAAASLAAIAVGVALRVRYGRVVVAFGAVGAGIAGAYATLAAATMLYEYLPSWAALLVAVGIAAVGGGIAVAWSSQILAGLALVGAAAAPGFFALDDQPTWPGTAFALVVFGATIAVASPRRWLWLQSVVAVVAGAQVLWLSADATDGNAGAVAVGSAAAFAFLAAAIAWQEYGGEELEAPTASFALSGGGLALVCPLAVIADDGALGFVLLGLALGFGATALGVAHRSRDLAWTIGAPALLLAGVAAAFLVSGRSLTVVWAIEAAVLAGLARRLGAVRFQAAALVYLAASAVSAVAYGVTPRSAAAGLFVLSGSALAVGLLQPQRATDEVSSGVAARLDPLWAALARARVGIRAFLAAASATVLVAALAAVLSGRALTVVLAALAVGIGLAAFLLGERRLQPFALALLSVSAIHALAVEVPPDTLAAGAADDVLGPVVSLLAIALAAAALAWLARFEDRGIAWLGLPAGPELRLAALERQEDVVRATLALVAATAGCWAAGLLAIDVSYDGGQVVATALWSLLGTAVVVLAARGRSPAFQAVGLTFVSLAVVKSAAFDWDALGEGAAVTSLLVSAGALLVSGFLARWESPTDSPLEVVALGAGATAAALAIVALERLLGFETRALGLASAAVAAVVVSFGVFPYRRLRSGGAEPWLRVLANGYWAIGLVVLLFAESELVLHGDAGTVAFWAATAGALALAWRPLAEDRVWLAGLALAAVAAFGALAFVTVPSRLVEATAHPATELWALAIVVAATWALGLTTPPAARGLAQWVLGCAAALTLYGVSLGVLEIAERVSGATVETDFQRGHTALSALWGIGALALYVVGLARDRRELRLVGLALFGLALAKLFLYDLASLSSITRAFSFLAVGSILLAAGFFAERFVRPGPSA